MATTQVQAQTFSGRAIGVQSNTTQTATVAGVATTTVLANVRVADTGPLPPAGGTLDTGILAGGAVATGVANATFSPGILNSRTTGSVVAGVPTSTSQSTVNNVNLNINGVTVTATTIQANSQCTCNGATPTCSGNVVLTNLAINGQLVTVDANGSIAPNTTLLSTSVTATVGTVTTTTTTTIIGNEQIRTANSITVNALRITTTTTVTDTLTNTTTTTTSDIIIAQAHSDITCGGVVPLLSADLALTKDCTISNNRITCIITVTNNGPDAATNVVITDNLPTNTTFVSATGSTGVNITQQPNVGATGGTVTGSIATLSLNQSATLTVVSNVAPGTPANTTIRNTATVASATTTTDPNSANNEAMGSVTTLITTAASATISGRVSTSKGRGLPRATVALTAPNGDVMYAVTNQRGYYRFADLEVGENYVLSVRSKRYVFETKTVFVTEDLADIDFAPME
ncbi:MAG: choice-of-anchor P family protein [Pyrinomonadaceae bacterium]